MARTSYRPLAGCKLFHDAQLRPAGRGLVTVPLRGVSCFLGVGVASLRVVCYRPLAGCKLFLLFNKGNTKTPRYRPLAGCKLFPPASIFSRETVRLPSPCGV